MSSVKLTPIAKESNLAYIYDLAQGSSRPMHCSGQPVQRRQKLNFGAVKLESTQTWNGSTYSVKPSELIFGTMISSRLDKEWVDLIREIQ